MIFRQKLRISDYSLYFILWSDKYPEGKDKNSPGGWGRNPDSISNLYTFKLELVL